MRVSIKDKDNYMCYHLSDLSPEYEKVLKDNHYIKEGDSFYKCFKLPFANTTETKHNFLKYAEEMFSHIVSLKPMKWKEGLMYFASIAKDSDIDWWTTGKAALALMGVDVIVDDLDFIFYTPDITLVNEAFKEYIVEPIVSTEGTKRDGIFKYYHTAGHALCLSPLHH